MKKHLTKVVYTILDYASCSIGMLLVVPIVLHRPMIYPSHHYRLTEQSFSPLCYGLAALLIYLPLLRQLNVCRKETSWAVFIAVPFEVEEEGSRS